MLIQGTAITIRHKKIESVKQLYYENQSILKEYFNEATVLPIPDDAPPEIPRIIIKTLQEHAQLNISLVATTFEIYYNKGFERNWNDCSKYIFERMTKVFEFLDILTNKNYEFIGLVTNLLFDDIMSDGANKISTTLLKSKDIKDIHDIEIKYTFVENSNIFVNIALQNARIFRGNIDNSDVAGAFSISNQEAESIGIVIDINDRYGFNNNKNYKTSFDTLTSLVDCMTDNINNKINSLIEKGVY